MKRPKYIRTFSNDHHDYTKLAVFSALPKPETYSHPLFSFLKSGVLSSAIKRCLFSMGICGV